MAERFSAILEIAATIGLPVPEAYRDSVIANYERLLQQAGLVMAAALSDPGEDSDTEFVP